jgi:predicted 3-demethylubiquinone-9 3-methyltransferase (glyoxalase superfamily)
LGKYINGPDKNKSQRAMKAMLQMKQIDINKIKEAYDGK